MKSTLASAGCLSLVISMITAQSLPVKASLGQSEKTLVAEAEASGAKHIVKITDKFNQHEVTKGSLSTREYADKNGTIFAVSWRGGHAPDLQSLFGAYFRDYSNALSAPVHRRVRGGPRTIKGAGVAVEVSGHMRALYGRAYVPALIPVGVKVDDIK